MKKTYKLIVIGILALVLALVNYYFMYPISQQQFERFQMEAIRYGWNYGYYEEGYPWNMKGVNWSLGLQEFYDAYAMTMNEIYIVSFICIAVAIVCFSIAVYYLQKRYKASRIETYTHEQLV